MWRLWLNLLYPAQCLLCGVPLDPTEPPTHLCHTCRQRLHPHQPPFCVSCGRPLPFAVPAGAAATGSGWRCPQCVAAPHSLERVWAMFPYDETLKRSIHLVKFGGRIQLLDDFGSLMAAFAEDHRIADSTDVITPVPLHPVRLRERGFNQSERLARILGRRLMRPVAPALVRTRPTPPQSRHARAERLIGVRDAFAVRRPSAIADRAVLLVDDVMTTGATLDACGRALRAGGARRVLGFVLAHG